jgi:hypothetical protein
MEIGRFESASTDVGGLRVQDHQAMNVCILSTTYVVQRQNE